MDADDTGTSKRGRPGPPGLGVKQWHPKLKFKPKVPAQKRKKSTAEKQGPEEPKPVDKELLKTLRTDRGAANTSPDTKDHSTQDTPSMLSSATRVSLPLPQSGVHTQDQLMNSPVVSQKKKALNHPITLPFAINEEEDEEEDDNVKFQENLLSSTQCKSSTHPAKGLNLLEQDEKTRMFLFQFPKLPLPSTAIGKEVKEGSSLSDKEVKEGSSLSDLPGGHVGKMLVYKSGKVKMKLGDILFNVNAGTECWIAQDAVAMNTKEKHCCELGKIERKRVVVTPDVDSLLNDT